MLSIKPRRCAGFPPFDGCDRPAGSTHSDHWCPRCDLLRRQSIERSLEEIMARFEEMRKEEAP